MHHNALRLADGRVMVAGGGRPPERAEIFDPGAETWTQAADLPKGLQGYVLVGLADGSVLLVGSSPSGSGQAFVYEPARARWRRAAPPAVGRYGGHTLTPLPDGTVLLVGGAIGPSRSSGDATLTDVAERYDPTADVWRSAGQLKPARGSHEAFALKNGNVMIVGGSISDRHVRYTQSVALYDPAANVWRTLQSARTAESMASTLLEDGRLLLVSSHDQPNIHSLQIGDPATAAWQYLCHIDTRPIQPLAVLPGDLLVAARAPVPQHGLTLIPLRGRGVAADAVTDLARDVEACSTRALSVPPDFPLGSSQATVLADGRVLFTGGLDGRPSRGGPEAGGYPMAIPSNQAWLLTPCQP